MVVELSIRLVGMVSVGTSQKIREPKYVSYDAQLCPVIAKGQRAPNAQLTHQIVDRHHEELKSSSPDSQTLKNPV
jgi:hypothetical protein